MEPHRRPSRLSFFTTIRERLRALQTASAKAKSDPQKIKTFRGLVLVFLAIVFGWISLQATETSGIAKYRMQTWPKESVWKKMLAENGLSLKTNIGDYGPQLQTHPDAFSGEALIWVSPDGCMVYIPGSPYHDRSSELWTCELNPKPPRQWMKAGSGIDGFEKLVDFLEKSPKKTPIALKPRLNIVDPKEIRY
jgi:hypothetical protein